MTESAPRIVGRPFRPGHSGNPGGRPKDENEVRNLARRHSRRALERLIELIDSEDQRVALAAAKEVLDRAYGKPKQEDDRDHDGGLTIRIVRFGDNLLETASVQGSGGASQNDPC